MRLASCNTAWARRLTSRIVYAIWMQAYANPLPATDRMPSALKPSLLIRDDKMMHRLTFYSTLLILGLGMPIAAQASCSGYQNDTFTLYMPATITVPDSLPVGGVIARQAFSGTAPANSMTCLLAITYSNGRYAANNDPSTGAYPTGVPGVSLAVKVTTAHQGPVNTALHNTPQRLVTGQFPNYTSAEAIFYKTGTVTNGTVPAGTLFENKWTKSSNTFRLQQGNAITFIRPVATCDLLSNSSIELPRIKVTDLGPPGSGSLTRAFQLEARCSNGVTNVNFRFTGTPATGSPVYFANTGTSRGVALGLSRTTGGTLISNNGSVSVRPTLNGSTVLPLVARYFTTGTPSAGSFRSSVTVNITYN